MLFVRVREVLEEREGVRGGERLRLTRVAEREVVAGIETEAEELGATEAESDMVLREVLEAAGVPEAVREALAVALGESEPVSEADLVGLDEPVIVPVCEKERVLEADAVTDPACEEEGVSAAVEVGEAVLDGVFVDDRVAFAVPDRVWLEVLVVVGLAVSVWEAVPDSEDKGVPPVCVAVGEPVCEEEGVLVCVDEGVLVGVGVGST